MVLVQVNLTLLNQAVVGLESSLMRIPLCACIYKLVRGGRSGSRLCRHYGTCGWLLVPTYKCTLSRSVPVPFTGGQYLTTEMAIEREAAFCYRERKSQGKLVLLLYIDHIPLMTFVQ